MPQALLLNERLHPRYWPTWLGFGFMWLIARLPYSIQMAMGSGLGKFMRLFKRRRFVCAVNLELAFPEKSQAERDKLLRQVFDSVGKGLIETAITWFGSDNKIHQLVNIEGLENLEAARQTDKGIILLGSHFIPIEICGRRLGQEFPFHTTYKPTGNPVFEYMMHQRRKKIYGGAIPVGDMRNIVRTVRKGGRIWYAPDQGLNRKGSVFVPFFEIPTATTTGTSRIAKMSGAVVIPTFTIREPDNRGYTLHILPQLMDFPGESPEDDTARVIKLIEEWVRIYPDQYLWLHRRFKHHPDGGKNRYQRYMENQNKARFD